MFKNVRIFVLITSIIEKTSVTLQKTCVCVCVCYWRQPLQEQVVERLLAAAAARHAKQQRVSEQRRAVRAAARAVVSVVRALPQVEREQHLLLLLLLQLAQLVPEHKHVKRQVGEAHHHEAQTLSFQANKL